MRFVRRAWNDFIGAGYLLLLSTPPFSALAALARRYCRAGGSDADDPRGDGPMMPSNPEVAVADLDARELPGYHRNIDRDEVMLSHADENPLGRRPGSRRHTPRGDLQGAAAEYRAEFRRKRQPGRTRAGTMVGVDTCRRWPSCPN